MSRSSKRVSPPREELRRFGLVLGAVCATVGSWWLWRGKLPAIASILAGIGALLVAVAALAPALLERPHRLSTAFGEAMGFLATRVILTLVYLLVVTPIGVVMRLAGVDPLRRRAPRSGSYWHDVSERRRDPGHFEKMY